MPPCGFREKGVNGLLIFVKGTYKTVLRDYEGKDLTNRTVFKNVVNDIKERTEVSIKQLDLNFSNKTIEGLQAFLIDNFKYMLDIMKLEIKKGYGVNMEIGDIERYLDLHLEKLGDRVKSFTLGDLSSVDYKKIPKNIRN